MTGSNQVRPERCTTVTGSTGSTNVNIMKVGLEPATLAVIVSLVVVIGACGVVMGLNLAKQAQLDKDQIGAQKQAQLVERRLMDMEAYAILNGWKVPGDDTHGPTGNIQRIKPQEKSNGRR